MTSTRPEHRQGAQPIAILIGALGGQGGGVLAEWLVQAATRAGYAAQSTSIPGVAQRTGATTYYVEIHPQPLSALDGRRPVLGLYPVPSQVDLVIASELLEAGRMMHAGYVSPDRTTLVTSTHRTLTTAEKMALGDGRFSSDRLLATARAFSRRLLAFDMDAVAREAGTVVSSVMLGAIAGTGLLPIASVFYTDVVRASGVGGEESLRGFARAVAAVASSGDFWQSAAGPERTTLDSGAPLEASRSGAPIEAVLAHFPGSARELIAHGHRRVVEFQDLRYGALYLQRLRAIDERERAAMGTPGVDARVLRETARFLALWMTFDDIARVAQLKSRAARYARVRTEVGAQPDDVVRIVDHFKPGVPEFAGILPSSVARRLVAWDARRQARGHESPAWPIHLRAHSIHGTVLLRTLGALRHVRRFGARYAEEQRAIERWLRAIERACAERAELGYEVALCGRLVKGYGATNVRGKANLAHILDHVLDGAMERSVDERIVAIRNAREAALADEAGTALDAELARHGAPPRPLVAQPVRFVPRSRAVGNPSTGAH